MTKCKLGLFSCLVIAGTASACGGSDSDISTSSSGSGGASTSTSAAQGGGSTTSTSGDPTSSNTASSNTAASTGPGMGGAGQGGAGQGGAGQGGGSGDICDKDPNDDACAACVKGMCCAILKGCINDTACACTVDCVQNGGDGFTCASQCNNIPPNGPTTAIQGCYEGTCANDCG